MRSLKEHRQAVLAPEIAGHRGRIVNTAGDGLLVEFASVVDAVDCAYAIQARIAERNADVETGRRLEFRIGINLGDVIVDGDDIFGDGVNVAARLEAIAEPGGICVSAVVHDQVMRQAVSFDFRGSRRADRQEHRPAAPGLSAGRRMRRHRRRPHRPCSPARQAIDRRPALREHERRAGAGLFRRRHRRGHHHRAVAVPVAVRHRPQFELHLQGPRVDVQQVGRELGVRYVLEGSVRAAETGSASPAQLIEAATRSHLWAEALRSRPRRHLRACRTSITAERGWRPLRRICSQAEIERAQRKPTDEPGCLRSTCCARCRWLDVDAAKKRPTAIELLSRGARARARPTPAPMPTSRWPTPRSTAAPWGLRAMSSGEGDRPCPPGRAAGRRGRVALAHAADSSCWSRRGTSQAARAALDEGGDAQSEPDDGVCLPRACPGHGRRARARDRGRHPRLAPEPARSGELPAPDGAGDFPHMASPVRRGCRLGAQGHRRRATPLPYELRLADRRRGRARRHRRSATCTGTPGRRSFPASSRQRLAGCSKFSLTRYAAIRSRRCARAGLIPSAS